MASPLSSWLSAGAAAVGLGPSPGGTHDVPKKLKVPSSQLKKDYPQHFLGGTVDKRSDFRKVWNECQADIFLVDGCVKLFLYDQDGLPRRVLDITSPSATRAASDSEFMVYTLNKGGELRPFVFRASSKKDAKPRDAWIDGVNGLLSLRPSPPSASAAPASAASASAASASAASASAASASAASASAASGSPPPPLRGASAMGTKRKLDEGSTQDEESSKGPPEKRHCASAGADAGAGAGASATPGAGAGGSPPLKRSPSPPKAEVFVSVYCPPPGLHPPQPPLNTMPPTLFPTIPTQVVRLGRKAERRNLPESGESPAPGEGA